MNLRFTTKYTYKNGNGRPFYGCSRYPDCTGTHGAHPDGRPMGTPADATTKAERVRIHKLCEKIWGDWETATTKEKQDMYTWLKENGPKEHIGEMNLSELYELEKTLMRNFGVLPE